MTTTIQNVSILERADAARQMINKKLAKKEKLRQYFSSSSVASLMASMMDYKQNNIRILDPGAGVGSLFTACVQRICNQKSSPEKLDVVAYEIDDTLFDSINNSIGNASDACRDMGIKFSGILVKRDLIEDYARKPDILSEKFTHVIMNPPYEKINVSSKTYVTLNSVGLQTTNMYSAFVAISHNLLGNGGQMTFITPRSFCNGSYFFPFRRDFLNSMSIRRIHLFNSRTSSFSEDMVLQENVIISSKKNGTNMEATISSSNGPADKITERRVKRTDIVFDDDPQMFIHIVPDEAGAQTSDRMRGLPLTLDELDMDVSTGKVVDFRIRDELRFEEEDGAVPLVRPFNISDGVMQFPVKSKKHCNFIMENKNSEKLLTPNGNYVLVKRFTTLEQKKRITASVWSGSEHDYKTVGFENRVNYFHSKGRPLPEKMGCGLWVFLNSSAVDDYFRQFNGSTQVNATDLRYMRYPSRNHLEMLGGMATSGMSQNEIDCAVNDLLFDSGNRAQSQMS